MLDTDTKRRIDTARDILVGKVPDPKSQVEQITIALIYKFMDDMDAEAEELGGKRKFFAGDFARYGWAKLMRSGLGGHETLNLYAEAIAKMPENPGIPLLFRDIFKNAYLPQQAVGVTMRNLNQGILSSIQIPLPPLVTQQAIVAEIETEQALVRANRELIARFEKKIQATLARAWGEDEPASAEA